MVKVIHKSYSGQGDGIKFGTYTRFNDKKKELVRYTTHYYSTTNDGTIVKIKSYVFDANRDVVDEEYKELKTFGDIRKLKKLYENVGQMFKDMHLEPIKKMNLREIEKRKMEGQIRVFTRVKNISLDEYLKEHEDKKDNEDLI